MVVQPTGALDLWNLFVSNVFGSFWLAVIGLMIVMFIILIMGRVSIFTNTWFLVMFLLAMTLGYGYVTINIIITVLLLVAFFFSWQRYIDSK